MMRSVFVSFFAFVGLASASFFELLPQGTIVTSLSADGRVAAGSFFGAGTWTWTRAGGLATVPGTASGADGNVALSADGSTLAATKGLPHSQNATAAICKDGHCVALSGRPAPSSAWGLSPDASVVVGLAPVSEKAPYPVSAAVWRADGSGAVQLSSTVPGGACRANVASAGGRVIGGWQDLEDGLRAGAVWEEREPGMWKQRIVRDADGHPLGEVTSVSADGTVLTGIGMRAYGTGGWVILPGQTTPTVFGTTSAVFGASSDGSLVGGTVGPVGDIDRTGFLWTSSRGVESLLPALQRLLGDAFPNDVTASDLGTVTAISADGSTVAGWGWSIQPTSSPGPHGWIARLWSEHGVPNLDAEEVYTSAFVGRHRTQASPAALSSGGALPVLCLVLGFACGGLAVSMWKRRRTPVFLQPALLS
eukprot:TRINITY_DN22941_c0_g1_i1.p1 TRINITY_DN22941_c0_g1~~TRINITY_DN22941_c0_g1_i1.p1  ORF type:complete len:432 (+),score=35.78 TRINITY_DN22941_c0_g1_i1:34-1296(+)